jgi:hypothetical protein
MHGPSKIVTWRELKGVVRNGRDSIEAYLKATPKKYRGAMALALSVAHWHPSERAWLWDSPMVRTGGTHCALCRHFHDDDNYCRFCPLDEAGYACEVSGSLWWGVRGVVNLRDPFYLYSQADREKAFNLAADKMYNVLVELYAKEWEKL